MTSKRTTLKIKTANGYYSVIQHNAFNDALEYQSIMFTRKATAVARARKTANEFRKTPVIKDCTTATEVIIPLKPKA